MSSRRPLVHNLTNIFENGGELAEVFEFQIASDTAES